MDEREYLVQRQAELERRLDDFRRQLAHVGGIVDVGIGLKNTADRWTDQTSFQVFVEQKRAESELAADQIIPTEFEGIAVDVIEVTSSGPTSDSSEHRPLTGGIQIVTSKGGGIGTLGCIARLDTPQAEPVILSNHHVLSVGGAVAGDEIGQPSYTDSCCCTCGDIAVILPGGSRGGQVDCAVAKIKADIGWNADIRTIGNVTGVKAAVVGETVRKVGAMSDLTTGTVASITFPTTSDGISFTNQILVNPAAGDFQIGGDSGAALVNAAGEVIGLMWGRNPGNGGPNGVASPINAVLTTLNITIPTSGGGTVAATTPLGPVDGALRELEGELQRSPGGRRILTTIGRHRAEVFDLVNHNRAVLVAWRRNEGPAFLATVLRQQRGAATPVPKEVNGVPLSRLLIAMAATLQEHGSPALRRDLEQHAVDVMHVVERGAVLGDLTGSFETVPG